MEMERCDRRRAWEGKKQMSVEKDGNKMEPNTLKKDGVSLNKVEREEMTEAKMQTKEEEG